jgi:hypothetical protein
MSSRLLKLLGSKTRPPTIDYRASDDLESLFYIFLEITIKYGGFGQTSNEGQPPEHAPLWRSAYEELSKGGLLISSTLKKDFMKGEQSYKPTPFFRDCYTILEEWRTAIHVAMEKGGDVSHQEIREIINQGLMNLESFSPVAAPPLPPPASLRPSAKTLPLTVLAVTSDSNGLPPSASGSTGRITRSMQKNKMLLPAVPNVSLPPLPSGSMAEDLDNGSHRNRRRRPRKGT